MEINFLELWARMGTPVRGVVIVLTLQALACVTVVIDRVLVLFQSAAKARSFAELVQPALEQRRYAEALSLANEVKGSHLALYLALGLRTFTSRLGAGDAVGRAAELARRALERKG